MSTTTTSHTSAVPPCAVEQHTIVIDVGTCPGQELNFCVGTNTVVTGTLQELQAPAIAANLAAFEHRAPAKDPNLAAFEQRAVTFNYEGANFKVEQMPEFRELTTQKVQDKANAIGASLCNAQQATAFVNSLLDKEAHTLLLKRALDNISFPEMALLRSHERRFARDPEAETRATNADEIADKEALLLRLLRRGEFGLTDGAIGMPEIVENNVADKTSIKITPGHITKNPPLVIKATEGNN